MDDQVQQFQRHYPVGVPYPNYARENILNAAGTVRQRAIGERVSESTVRRIDTRYRQTRSVAPLPHAGGPPRKLSQRGAAVLAWFIFNYPQATNKELLDFVKTGSTDDADISLSLISLELKRLGMSSKIMRYFSAHRDEADRVNFWCNPPNHPERAGVLGLSYWNIIDLDESGFNPSRANRRVGRSLFGLPARAMGRIQRGEVSYTMLIAVDCRVGILSRLIFEGACNGDIFFVFFTLFLLPALRFTGNRTIVMDNLGAHRDDELRVLAAAEGHQIIFRPIHSPDFGAVEWVFQAATAFLEEHDNRINGNTLRPALNTFLDLVSPEEIAAYFACARFPVPGHLFKPYMGQN